MKGLFLKDFYVAKKNLRVFLLMILVFTGGSLAAGGSGGFFLCYGIVIMPGITMSLISYDERYHWDSYAGAMPLSRAQLVTEKYLLHLVMVLVWLPVLLVLQHFQQVPAFGGAPLTLLVAGLNLGLLLPGILLPIIFALGTEKGRAGYYVVLFGGMILATVSEELTSLTGYVPEAMAGIVLILLPAAVYVLSWRIAIRLYEKRNL
ncbi:MAG: ABC-2 transporter permease [Candidatus Limivicinus sp.]|nr:ABC-2 transporter permease [Candidatus Limivicinus sp.]